MIGTADVESARRPGLADGAAAASPSELAVLAAVVALALAVRLAFGAHLRDDAFITMRYAQHVATGLGFTFDDGEKVLGTTTPLFTLILAAGWRLGLPIERLTYAIGIVADGAVVALLWERGRRRSARVGVLAAVVYALLPPTVSYATSGMETSLYLALILVAFLLTDRGVWPAGALVCGLTTLLRPDGVLVPISIVAIEAWRWFQGGRIPLRPRPVARAWAIYLLVVGPWVLFAWSYFGSPIPQSLVAKWDLHLGRREGLLLFLSYFLDLGDRWFLPLTLLAGLGAALAARRARPGPFTLWSVAYLAAFLLANKFVYPAWPFEWYFLPLLLGYCVLVAIGLDAVFRFVERRFPPPLRSVRLALALALPMLGVYHLAATRAALDEFVGGREALYREVASWLESRGVVDETVAAPEIGALGFAYPGPVLDLWGLVSPSATGQPFSATLTRERPAWFVVWDTDIPADLRASPWFDEHYRPVLSLENWESRHLVVYRWYPSPDPRLPTGPILGSALQLVDRSVAVREESGQRYLRITLTWRDLAPIDRTTISVQAIDSGGRFLASRDNEPQEGTRPTSTWGTGQLVVDRYDLRLPPGAEPARLLVIGYPTGHPRQRLTWTSSPGTPIGSVLALPAPEAPDPPVTSCGVAFDQNLRLDGLSVARNGNALDLDLRWDANGVVRGDYTIFVHAVNARGEIVGQADGPPLAGRLPTSAWLPGDRLDDSHPITLHGDASRLEIGWYQPDTGRRLARLDGKGDTVGIDLTSAPGCKATSD